MDVARSLALTPPSGLACQVDSCRIAGDAAQVFMDQAEAFALSTGGTARVASEAIGRARATTAGRGPA